MKIVLESMWGDQETLWILNPESPELTDEKGRRVLDLAPFKSAPLSPNPPDTPNFKYILDAFMHEEARGMSVYWMNYPDRPVYKTMFEDLKKALFLLTGRLLVSASK